MNGQSEALEINAVRLDSGAPLPRSARAGDAGIDLMAVTGVHLVHGGGRAVCGTGLCLAIPPGYCGLVMPRSGLARKHGVTCLNTPGLIDSGYRGEIQVLVVNTDPIEDYDIAAGDRIAQLVVVAFAAVRLVAVDALPLSERGEQGWGHSGR